MEFLALTAISILPLFRKHDESIAPSLSQGYAILEIPNGTMGKSDSLADPVKFRSLISTGRLLTASTRASRVHCRMAAPACHPCYPGSPPIGSGSFR